MRKAFRFYAGGIVRYIAAACSKDAFGIAANAFGLAFANAASVCTVDASEIGSAGYDRVVHADDDSIMLAWQRTHEARVLQLRTATKLSAARKASMKPSGRMFPEYSEAIAAAFAAMPDD